MSRRITLIANPAAGNGLGARRIAAARAAFAPLGADVRLTTAPGDEARLAADALAAGADVIAVLGGDGTWGRVARVLADARSATPLAFLSAGSGNDFVKSLGAPAADFAATARLVAEGRARAIDVGRCGDVTFLNSVGFAFDAAVVERLQRAGGAAGRLTYMRVSLGILFGYPGIDARIGDASRAWSRYLGLVVANGRHFGGSFVIAPRAELADGALDIVTIDAPMNALRRAATFAACARGAHGGRAGVGMARAASTRLAFRAPPLFEADGELYAATTDEVSVTCLPGALRVVA